MKLPDDPLTSDAEAMQHLFMRLSLASRRLLANELELFGLTVPQYTTLRALHARPDGCTMSALAAATHQVSATMTGIISRLVEHGLVQRQAVPNDRRALCISLTREGMRIVEKIEDLQSKHVLRVLHKLSPQERRELLRLMQIYLETTLAELPPGSNSTDNHPA